MKCLTLNEMIDLVRNDGDLLAHARFVTAANALAEIVAAHICKKHSVVSLPATTEDHELGGTGCYFGPEYPGDVEPNAFKNFDQGQPWNDETKDDDDAN